MSLFQSGNFTLHSGNRSIFKIDCDFIPDSGLVALAPLGHKIIGPFSSVIGVPATTPGGIDNGARFAKAMLPYVSGSGPILIVDDVLSTGRSMNEMREKLGVNTVGLVIFAREKPPEWIKAIFQQAVDI